MAIVQDREPLTLQVPASVIDQVRESATQSNRTLEEEAEALLEQAIRRRADARESLKRAQIEYEAYLARTGQRRPTTEEIWEQLRRVREEVADELDPK